jgi:hypothetical protein
VIPLQLTTGELLPKRTFVVLDKQADLRIVHCIDGVRDVYPHGLVVARLLWDLLQRNHLRKQERAGGDRQRAAAGSRRRQQ